MLSCIRANKRKDCRKIGYIAIPYLLTSPKILVWADLGSRNMAHSTQRLIKDLEMILSPSRAYRPTDNSRQERWYRTVKQEEIYCHCPTHPSLEVARSSLTRYIHFYNEQRPPQALWNYPPGFVHRLRNKTQLLFHHRKMVQTVKEHRSRLNQAGNLSPL